ncbi:GyrI-like domain-containing protein [Phycicoccus sp.]|uniref:GyrI-like domain-containing protein n=1 Tax=Phycicoccus sp. TaxID=1902410 RepID=UPI002BCCED47|nr:GyrI-like domain-containing protein [Phycicoccus sp.]HMM95962.1 GyrI-like domain-containing protein [Phycicoccus sp.]
MTDFDLETVPATTVATLRRTVPVGELPEFFGTALTLVAEAVADAGGRVTVPPFAWYHSMPTDTVDVSAGFAVVGDVHTLDGAAGLHERPGGRAVVGVHVGPYDTLSVSWQALTAWTAGRGLAPRGEFWEEYLTEPEGDPAGWRTRLVALVD